MTGDYLGDPASKGKPRVPSSRPRRVGISKKLRFEVFKRDLFVCQYCGRKPPEVVLEVDHIVAVAAGGSNELHNLITSCFDCNRGKAAGSLVGTPIDVSERRALLEERLEQTRQFEALLAQQRREQDEAIDAVIATFEKAFEGFTLADSARPSIRRFLTRLPASEVVDAMEIACSRDIDDEAVFRYFCGVCWRKVEENR